jgi:hypothetical protein
MNAAIMSVVGSHRHERETEESETCRGQGGRLTQFRQPVHATA